MSDPPSVVVRITETRSPPTRLVTTAVMFALWSAGLLCDIEKGPSELGFVRDRAMGTICGALDLWSTNRHRSMCMHVTVQDFRLSSEPCTAENAPGAKLVMMAWAGAQIPLLFHMEIAPFNGLPLTYVQDWENLVDGLRQSLPELPVAIDHDSIAYSKILANEVANWIYAALNYPV